MNQIPCRKIFTDTLLECAKSNPEIFAVTSDARGSVTLDKFANELPNQFVELGIAEQNAVGVAAGLALSGLRPFVCGPACFYSARSLEQVKVDVAYTHSNVKIVGVSGGVSYGALGATHHSLHDLAVMRTFPNMTVILPSDNRQTEKLTQQLTRWDGPAYIRMGRNAVPDVYTDEAFSFEIGHANTLLDGEVLTIIACGETVYHALKAGEQLHAAGIRVRVLDMHTIKPLDVVAIKKAVDDTAAIITVEEHSVFGGLGAAVAEVVVQYKPRPMKMIGFPDENLVSGNSAELFEYYGLDSAGIVKAAHALLSQFQLV